MQLRGDAGSQIESQRCFWVCWLSEVAAEFLLGMLSVVLFVFRCSLWQLLRRQSCSEILREFRNWRNCVQMPHVLVVARFWAAHVIHVQVDILIRPGLRHESCGQN